MSELHLRDWRHANQFYTNFGHAFSPKVKFLYHVVFELNQNVPSNLRQNSEKFKKELSVLVNSTDLPSFRVNMENKQQYNRKKNLQTRVDYQDVQMRLYDDNVGSVRSMLQEYYQYYFEDGRHNETDGSFKQRDKYHSGKPPNYGLNTRSHRANEAFFKYIHIYQMGKNQWNRYTIVNPLIAQWSHGDVSYAEGASMVEHTINFGYESVFYANGEVGSDLEPKGFASAETGYDQSKHNIYKSSPNIGMPQTLSPSQDTTVTGAQSVNTTGSAGSAGIFAEQNDQPSSSLQNLRLPQPSDEDAGSGVSRPEQEDVPVLSSTAIRSGLEDNVKARTAFIAQAINSGTVVVDAEGVNSYLDYKQLPAPERRRIMNNAIDKAASGDRKLAQFASNAIARNK